MDPLAGEAVHVKRDEVHHDPKEVNVYSYFTARKHDGAAPAVARHAFKVRWAGGCRWRWVGGLAFELSESICGADGRVLVWVRRGSAGP